MSGRDAPVGRRASDCSGIVVLLVAALLAVGLTASASPLPVAAQTATGATGAAGAVGIVVRHGDGRLLYAYVPLTSDRITGAEALQRAGFALNLQSSSSLGSAVCKIGGEGCDAPREDCFCKSYSSPAYYWHYYLRAPDGGWRSSNTGAGNRVLRDGDVDGWSWTADTANLPAVTLAEIAAKTAVSQQSAVSSQSAASSQQPAASSQQPATATAPASLIAPASLPTPVTTPVSATGSIATATASDPQPRAVAVEPNGTAAPLVPPAPAPIGTPSANGGVAVFIAVAVAMLLLLAVVPMAARQRGRKR